jgi:hypothetical protein
LIPESEVLKKYHQEYNASGIPFISLNAYLLATPFAFSLNAYLLATPFAFYFLDSKQNSAHSFYKIHRL